MTLKLTEEKKQKIFNLCTKLFEKSKPTIRFVAQVIGNIVASFPAVPLGPLFYGVLETDKIVRFKGTGRTMMQKLNYQMKHTVNLLGGNITLKILFRI